MNNGSKVNPKKNTLRWLIALMVILCLSFNNYPVAATTHFIPANAGSALLFFQHIPDTGKDTVPPVRPDAVRERGTLPALPDAAFPGLDTIPKVRDTISGGADTIPVVKSDSLIQRTDTLNVKVSKDSIEGPIVYAALDSMVMDIPSKKIILYNEGSVKYMDLDLKAYKIELDQPQNKVIATFGRDSAEQMIGRPKFVQGETNMEMDSIIYNTKTRKGITRSTYTNQGEVFVYGEKIKKVSENDFYALRGRFTTCNLDTPHFAFQTNKMKLVNKKFAITGPVHPEFEGVPVPIYLPFGFFPMSQGRHSGLLPPQFATNEQFGIGLEGLGYYKVLNEYFDATIRGDIYSYGGYRLNFNPTYRKRYRYAGSMGLSYQSTRFLSDIGTKEFTSNKTFNINWSHSVDSKARPGTSFSASVNAGSTKYNQYVANSPQVNFQNQLSSSITYTKNWDNKYNLSVSANHNQNNNTRLVNLNLPNIAFNVTNFYPFQPAELVGEPKWYQKLGLGLTSNVTSQASFYDSLFSFKNLIDTFQWGAQHNIPISLSLPQLGPVQIAPGISYQQRWFAQRFIRTWNDTEKKLDTTITKGFYAAHDVSFSLSLSSAVFGTFNFKEGSRVKAIRHTIRPSLGVSYKPDLAHNDYYTERIDTSGRTYRFSRYDGAVFGAFGEGKFGGINFSLDNNLEMKARSKTDTSAEADKKIKLIDGFGFSGSYNMMADSFNLSTFNFYARSTLFEKVSITAGTTLDPYKVDDKGFRVNEFAWSGGSFSPGRITNGNVAISTSFQSKKKEETKKEAAPEDDGIPITMDEQQAELDYIRSHPAEFADFNIPWSVNLSYSLSFNKFFKPDYSGFETQLNSSLSLNGDFNLTPKWKVGMSTYYDFKGSSIQSLTLSLSREMHCWQMSINVTPVGLYKFFNITISPKSGMLRDLKINRTRSFYGGN